MGRSLTALGKVARDGLLSTATSQSDKWQEGSYEPPAGIVNSLTCKKPKKVVQHIVQNVVLSYEGGFFRQCHFNV